MSDLISRKDAIEALDQDVMGGLNYRRILRLLPSADRPKWIPCSERLPEEGLTVLILAESGNIEFGQRCENKWEWLAESIADYWTEAEEVIAWQPLPKRMESEENGND